ncbi:MAG TPA: HIT domain-containing protein [Fimbriimonas sp.]|nr:HIT domain-containing protein [Fimbriimonas sp.]
MTNIRNPQSEIPQLITSILAEPAIYSNDHFVVVADADPETPGHLLLLPRQYAECMAETGVEELMATLKGLEMLLGEPYFLIERGRADFCSSFGTTYAHAHLIPSACFDGRDLPEGEVYVDLPKAIEIIGDNEYLLAGPLAGPFQICRPGLANWPKRYARTFIKPPLH